MPTFVHPALLWGMLIVAAPVLIHLINMLRHRRVQWAAMEFLRQSRKKNRTWIVLKQLLLMLMRMAAIAAVVLIVAQPRFRNWIGEWFGATRTHHIVLLDDSFSMSDRWEDTSAFAEAKVVIERIGVEAARPVQPQSFTLLRFSRVGMPDRGTQPDILNEPVNKDFVKRLNDKLKKLGPSQTAAGPGPAIEAVGRLLGQGGGERRIVYLISDFRAREWEDPTDLQKQLLALDEAGAELQLVDCVETARPNLAITSLVPQQGVRAAGVPWFMEVTVRNFGSTLARQVPVLLEEDGRGRPAATIAEIPPGRAVKGRFPVHFLTAGGHEITARLESDAVAADNCRFAAIELPAHVPVLIVDGAADAAAARYLAAAMSPGGSVRTGVRPRIETPRFLSLHPIEEFQSINLVNVERLDESAIESLEEYVAAGGGVAFFLGENSRTRFINEQLYRNGEGLFPLPLAGQADLPVYRLEKTPDVQVEDHFIFRVFSGKRNSFLNMVLVERYFAAPDGWQPEPGSGTRVIARLRNNAPLAVEHSYGEGRVVAFLTTAAPVWNNWARNPSFVVAVQDLQAYLASRSVGEVSRPLGTKLELTLDAAEHRPQVRFETPDDDGTPTASSDAVPAADGSMTVSFCETDTSGIYKALLTKTNGATDVRRFALNVDAAEGDLKALGGPELAARLPGLKYDYRQARAFRYDFTETAGTNISQWLLYLLVVLLVAEQVVAWWNSYHPSTSRKAPAAGGVR